MNPGPRRLLLLLVTFVLLAGCASHGDHDHAHGLPEGVEDLPADQTSLLVGVHNQGTRDFGVDLNVTAPNGTVVWTQSFVAGAGANPEKFTPLDGAGVFTVNLRYSYAGDAGPVEAFDSATIDTAECGGISHLTFLVDGTDGFQKLDLHRECHEE